VRVFDGGTSQTYPFKDRQLMIGKDSRHPVPVMNRWASRNHATLAVSQQGVELTDLESRNGTFIGTERRRLAPNEPTRLDLGDVFWIGPEVKVELVEEEHDTANRR
jgi:pSer/pThr/pTyr-binding forkhead associated (FHA) protein